MVVVVVFFYFAGRVVTQFFGLVFVEGEEASGLLSISLCFCFFICFLCIGMVGALMAFRHRWLLPRIECDPYFVRVRRSISVPASAGRQ